MRSQRADAALASSERLMEYGLFATGLAVLLLSFAMLWAFVLRPVKRLRVAMMTASNHGITWAGDVSSIRMGWADGRDVAAKSALNTDADGVFWMDDDILLPAEAIVQLASHGKDFTSGMYFQKVYPHARSISSRELRSANLRRFGMEGGRAIFTAGRSAYSNPNPHPDDIHRPRFNSNPGPASLFANACHGDPMIFPLLLIPSCPSCPLW